MPTSSTSKKKEKSASSRRTRRVLLVLGGFIVFIFLSLFVIAGFFEDRVGRLVINEAKKMLATELQVERAELSLIWSFPNARVSLKNVRLKGATKDEDLLHVASVDFKFGLLSLLSGKYNVRSIAINQGALYVHTDKKGRANFDIMPMSEDSTVEETTSESELHLKIEEATFDDVHVHYVDEAEQQDLKLFLDNAYFAGEFAGARYTMQSNAEIHTEYLSFNGEHFFEDKDLAYDGTIDIDNEKGIYSFTDILLAAETSEFRVDGSLATLKDGTQVNMRFESSDTKLNALLQLLPESYMAYLGGFQSRANLSLHAEIDGLYNEKQLPKMTASLGLKNGRISHPSMREDMSRVNFDLDFIHQGKAEAATLAINNFTAELDGNPFALQLNIENLEAPTIDFTFNGELAMRSVYGFLGPECTAGEGFVRINNLSLKGNYKDMISSARIHRVDAKGDIQFDNIALTYRDAPIALPTGQLLLADNNFNVNDLSIKVGSSDVLLKGEFKNIVPVLFADSLNAQNAKLRFAASWLSENFNATELEQILVGPPLDEAQTPEATIDSVGSARVQKRKQFTDFLEGKFNAKIKHFEYGKVHGDNFEGQLQFKDNMLLAKGVRLNAMEGIMELNSKVYFTETPSVEAFLDCRDINIKSFFEQTENFGQDVLVADNLQGKLDAIIKINAFFDKKGNFKDEELFVLADILLRDGELNRFSMFEDFSKFIKIEDLRRVVFTNLRNQLRIEHRTLHIPAMFIRSNALNMVIAGSHTFDQDMDYKIKINAGQIVANKFKRHNPSFDPLPARERGLFNIYARIFGNLDKDYDFKLGKKHVKRYLEAELKKDLPELTNTLRQEFAATSAMKPLPPMAEPNGWQDIPEYGAETELEDDGGKIEFLDW